jgi:hypothetical protein
LELAAKHYHSIKVASLYLDRASETSDQVRN